MSTPLHLLPGLSLIQPWAWAVLHAGKRVENRSRRTHYRGYFLIHASLTQDVNLYDGAYEFMQFEGLKTPPKQPHDAALPRGCFVGVARVVDCVDKCESPWFVGPYGWLLDDVRAFNKPVYCKGALGFFKHNLPPELFNGVLAP